MNKEESISRDLKERRFSQKYRHTLNVSKYDGEIWNSNDIQFLALWQKRTEHYDSRRRRHYYYKICLDFFGHDYHYSTYKTVKEIGKRSTVGVPPEKADGLLEFLLQKPTDETFTLPTYKGDIHLSFENRGLFGRTELSWKFLHHKEHWDNSLFLPRQERNKERKYMKAREKRERLWFSEAQCDKLVAYMNLVLPYPFLS